MHDDDVTDDESESGDARVFDRLLAAGLSVERIEAHLAAGRVHVDGESVTDPHAPAPLGRHVRDLDGELRAAVVQSCRTLPGEAA